MMIGTGLSSIGSKEKGRLKILGCGHFNGLINEKKVKLFKRIAYKNYRIKLFLKNEAFFNKKLYIVNV